MRLKDAAYINRRILPETTDPDFSFRYIDISAVDNLGGITLPEEETRFETAPSRARRVAPAGSTVISTVRTYLRAIAQVPPTDEQLVFSTGFAVLEAKPDVDGRFLSYACQSQRFIDEVVARSMGVSYPAINPGELVSIEFGLPEVSEQRRIADFLDAETARIDALRASRYTQISVLEELELARIGDHLSTAESTGPVYAYFDVQLGKMLNPERASGERQQPYLRHANVHWYEISTEDVATMTFEPDERRRYGLQVGDLLVNEGGAGGTAEAAVWDGRVSACFYQKSLHRVRARGTVPVEWLMYWLRYAKASGIFDSDNNKATIPHLTREKLAESRIPIPADGFRRVSELSSEIAAIREAQRKMTAADTLLTERRQALITAAVTGGITV